MYLERDELEVDEAKDGAQALDKALKNDYDVILLDIMMPEMDGIEVCERLRQEKNTPVIMLTAKGEESNRVQGFEVGADDISLNHSVLEKSYFVLKQFLEDQVMLL